MREVAWHILPCPFQGCHRQEISRLLLLHACQILLSVLGGKVGAVVCQMLIDWVENPSNVHELQHMLGAVYPSFFLHGDQEPLGMIVLDVFSDKSGQRSSSWHLRDQAEEESNT